MADTLEQLQASITSQYLIERELGRGGMATVFLAKDVRHDRDVAVKVLHPELAATIGTERFEREIKLAAKLQHPHILGLYDSGTANALLYYVMPFVQGESLRDRLNREGQLSVDDALQITLEVADALGYAHGHGIVHRDIKPENIMLANGHALVADFGIARAVTESGAKKLTQTGMALGTPVYMSPEQSTGEHVGPTADIYSLGCVLYEMLAGEPPFTGKNSMAIMARHALDQVPSVRIVRPAVPEEVEEAIYHSMEKAPADRPKTAADFTAILGMPLGATAARRVTSRYTATRRIPTPPPVLVRQAWWRTPWAIVTGLVVLVGGSLAAWKLSGNVKSATPGALGDFDPTHIAVTYLRAEGGTADLTSLADGLTESLISNLSGIPTLHVVSRNGVAPLRSATPDSVARALKVGTVVTGTVRGQGDAVHVDVQLIDAASNVAAGSKGFDVRAADVASLRDSVGTQVAEFLRRQLGSQVSLAERRSETTSNQAWLALQRGERRRKDADSLAAAGDAAGALAALGQADTLLAAAASQDDKWAEPLALRGTAAVRRARVLRNKPADAQVAIDTGLAYAERALKLEARNADALEARGTLRYLRYQQLVSTSAAEAARHLTLAEKDLREATAINPAQASAFATLSVLYYGKQSVQEANMAAQNAYRADAYLASADQILTRLFWTSHDMENFADAERWCNEGHRRFPVRPFFVECSLWLLTTKYKEPYDPKAAWRLYDSVKKVTPPALLATDTLRDRIVVAMVLARAADAAKASDPAQARVLADSARRVLMAARASPALDPRRELAGFEAVARVFLHDYDEAVALIEGYVTINPEHARGFKTNTAWWWRDPGLQNHPRFKTLLASIR